MDIDDIAADDGLTSFVTFPENLAKTSNKTIGKQAKIIFRNYHRYVNDQTLE